MSKAAIEVERDGEVGVIWLNDPSTLNSMDLGMFEELDLALDELVGTVRCIVLSGRGRAFSSGAKIAGDDAASPASTEEPDLGATLESHINPLLTRFRELPIPWITAVRGAAAGVGCSLALAADFIVASENAYFMQAFSRIGLVPDGGSSFLLTRSVGRVRAMEMMLLGDRVPADTALAWGMISRVVPDAKLHESAMELARKLAGGPTRTFAMVRELVWKASEADWGDTLGTERRLQRDAGRTPDFAEGVRAFLEKRAPRFTGI